MKLNLKMEVALVVITSILCTLLLLKILDRLRSALPWRVNCWFCNSNIWVKYPDRNSWTCPRCEQYNGFTKDGDYNKTLIPANDQVTTPKLFQKNSPRNGFCKMCNINQQLKVIQLANFIPMNEKKFDEEIESYRMQLEKAYKLCSPCKRVLQVKLHKEKETLLGTKLLETRSGTVRKNQKQDKKTKVLRDMINITSTIIAAVLFILVSYELYSKIKKESLPKTIYNFIEIVKGILDRLGSITKMKIFTTFPNTELYANEIYNIHYIDMLPNSFNFRLKTYDNVNAMSQKALAVIACLLQIIANVWNVNSFRYTIAIDLLWTVFVISVADVILALHPLLTPIVKMMTVFILLLVYKSTKKADSRTPEKQSSPKPIRRLTSRSASTLIDQDGAMVVDSDDDVSLSKFGLHNLTESSNETASPLSESLLNGRTFSPRNDSLWTKPKLNSTFCVNSVMRKSPHLSSEPVFAKPSFRKYQQLAKYDSDSDLDESIGSLSLGGPTKSKNKSNSIFSLRKFNASPNFVTPVVTKRARPLISPSKLGSWVAGGYWGPENDRQNVFNVEGSRSSSQSSGFESQTSSMTTRNVFSHPPSREESVCGEPAPTVMDRFSVSGYQQYSHTPHNFSRMSTPVFPQMQYNGHVHIPQARFAQQPTHNLFINQAQYVQNGTFKTPGSSGLIKLPQVNSFAPH